MFDQPHPRGPRGGRGSKLKKSGKFHELPRESIKQFYPHQYPTGGGGVYGSKLEGGRDGREGWRDVIAIMKLVHTPFPLDELVLRAAGRRGWARDTRSLSSLQNSKDDDDGMEWLHNREPERSRVTS